MLDAFQAWFRNNQDQMQRDGISVSVTEPSRGYGKDAITAELKTASAEALVCLWETGESEFEYLDWKAADGDVDYQPKDTSYEFAHPEELYVALDALAARLTGHSLPQAVTV